MNYSGIATWIANVFYGLLRNRIHTIIMLSPSELNATAGETIPFYCKALNLLHVPVANKTLLLFVDGKNVETATTDVSGFVSFMYRIAIPGKHVFFVSDNPTGK